LSRLREAVGLRDLSSVTLGAIEVDTATERPPLATFKQYRDADGRFYFKLVEGERVLLQSHAFDAPRDAGETIAALKRGEGALAGAPVALGEGVAEADVRAAIHAMAAAEAQKTAAKEG